MPTEVTNVTMVRLDSGCSNVEISIDSGSTTVGRGPAFQISDKRVSRSHAILQLQDGILQIKPVHINPTFYKGKGEEKFKILKKDCFHMLYHHDQISLLPDSLRFEVNICTENGLASDEVEKDKVPKENSGCSEVVCQTSGSPLEMNVAQGTSSSNPQTQNEGTTTDCIEEQQKCENHDETLPDGIKSKEKEERKPALMDSTPDLAQAVGSVAASRETSNKKRILPSWMTKGLSKESEALQPKKRRQQGKCRATKTEDENEVDKDSASSRLKTSGQKHNNEKEEAEAVDNQEAKDVSLETENERPGQGTKMAIPPEPSAQSTFLREDDMLLLIRRDRETNDLVVAPITPGIPPNHTRASACNTNPMQPDATATSLAETRPPPPQLPLCPYGSRCYRKNPVHFQEYGHQQSASPNSASQDDLPECPYGKQCYRKNPRHFEEFKHTGSQGSGYGQGKKLGKKRGGTRARRSVLAGESDDDDGLPNTYDYDDSFIDDEESSVETGSSQGSEASDPDFNPGSDEEEDISTLISEAEGFVRHENK